MPGNTFKNKDIAAKAGSKSKPGKHAKTKQWEALGEMITGELTDDVLRYVKGLKGEEKFNAYLKLLEYFKPKLSRSEVKAEIDNVSEKINTVYAAIQSEPGILESEPEEG